MHSLNFPRGGTLVAATGILRPAVRHDCQPISASITRPGVAFVAASRHRAASRINPIPGRAFRQTAIDRHGFIAPPPAILIAARHRTSLGNVCGGSAGGAGTGSRRTAVGWSSPIVARPLHEDAGVKPASPHRRPRGVFLSNGRDDGTLAVLRGLEVCRLHDLLDEKPFRVHP
jgi:hypothetical protein